MQHLTFVRVNYPIYLGLEQIVTVTKLYKKHALNTITDVATALRTVTKLVSWAAPNS